MQLNLRKARKLEAKIAKYIESAELKSETNVRAKANLSEATQKITDAGKTLIESLETLRKLNEVRYSIRSQIANANQGVGINALMTEREQLKSKSQILQKLMNATTAPSTEEVQDILETTAKALDKGETRGYGRNTEVTVNISVITEDVRKAVNEEIKATIKGLEDVEDELAQKNLGAKVTLSDEQVALLKASALV